MRFRKPEVSKFGAYKVAKKRQLIKAFMCPAGLSEARKAIKNRCPVDHGNGIKHFFSSLHPTPNAITAQLAFVSASAPLTISSNSFVMDA